MRTGGFKSELEEIPVSLRSLSVSERDHRGAVADFFDALTEGREPLSPAEDNFHSLAMVHAAVRSSENGGEVDVESL